MFKLTLSIICKDTKCTKIVTSAFHTSNCRNVEVKEAETYRSVAEFYAGKSVFVTGGTGYLGKVFIEKLLHNCPEIQNVYMLIRDKSGVSVNHRLNEVFNNPLFQKLREKRPNDLKKVVPIIGDVALPDLGITAEDEQLLKDKVSVVIHSAASVRFFEPLKKAVNINLEGSKRILNLCKNIKNLEAFVHISTAYTNFDRLLIDEVVYPPPRPLDEVYRFMNTNHSRDELTKFLNGKPNTYTFTKAMTEHYLLENCGDLPAAIVRPSIVTSIAKEPLPGWVDNWAGTALIAYGLASGKSRVAIGNGKNIVDWVPVDYVANVAVVAATKCRRNGEMKVYNSTTSGVNPLPYKTYYEHITEETIMSKKNELPFPMYIYCDKQITAKFMSLLLEKVPAHIMDLWRKASGKPPIHVDENIRIGKTRDAVTPFLSGSWTFLSQNVIELEKQLSEDDKATFPCLPNNIDIKDYLYTLSKGIRTHLLNQKD